MKKSRPSSKPKSRVVGLLERRLADPVYRANFEREYPVFMLEIQILQAMERKGWTFEDLAKATHTKKSNVSRDLTAGGIRLASIPRLQRMATALGMDFVPLFIDRKSRKTILPKLQALAAIR